MVNDGLGESYLIYRFLVYRATRYTFASGLLMKRCCRFRFPSMGMIRRDTLAVLRVIERMLVRCCRYVE